MFIKRKPFLTLEEELLYHVHQWDMLTAVERCVLAVSGGVDSMVMLHVMHKLHEEGRLPVRQLHVAHLNHKLRGGESDEDSYLVAQEARKRGLTTAMGMVDVAAAAAANGESIELTARRLRYAFLAATAQKKGCRTIALAHNADDHVETVLHRIVRGTGIRGLAGIPPVRQLERSEIEAEQPDREPPVLIRPLLTIPRREIEHYAAENGIPFREDTSNASAEYTRNQIRHDLLPRLRRKYNPDVDQALLKLSAIANDLNELLADDIEQLYRDTMEYEDEEIIVLNADLLRYQARIQQSELVRYCLNRLNLPLRPIGYKHIDAVLRLLNDLSKRSEVVQLPRGLKVRGLPQGALEFHLGEQETTVPDWPAAGAPLNVPGSVNLPAGCVFYDSDMKMVADAHELTADFYPDDLPLASAQSLSGPRREFIDADRLKGGLFVRGRRKGDTFVPLGAPGAKKLGDFLTDHHVPPACRDRLPLLCDEAGILWVPGLRIADRVKITAGTKTIVYLEAVP